MAYGLWLMAKSMQRNVILISVVLLIFLLSGIVLFKNRISTPQPATTVAPTQAPRTSSASGEVTQEEANITVTSPGKDTAVQLPMIITGQARVFENVLSYRITNEAGAVLSSGNTMADSPDAGQFGPYTITITNLGDFTEGKMQIEVFQNSARDGSEIDKVTIPVTLQ